jgi:IS5 family transposase
MQQYKVAGNRGLFDEAMNYERLSEIGNPLERILAVIEFEGFRGLLENHLTKKDRKSIAGAKPYDVVMMFKILNITTLLWFRRYTNRVSDN